RRSLRSHVRYGLSVRRRTAQRGGPLQSRPDPLDAYQKIWPMQPDNRTVTGRTILERRIVHIPDVEQEPRYTFAAAYRASIGIRPYLGGRVVRGGNPIGATDLYRGHVALFSDREIELVKAFADQAVIAIENTRLLNELRQRTDDLRESLQ